MSRIHWPATAQQQRIMVYNNDYTSRQSVTIILNMQSRQFEHQEVVDEDRMGKRHPGLCRAVPDGALGDADPVYV